MADELVLAAQKWVNSAYANVAGYTKCPETGNTGWSTMYSLTRALQHELGITALSNSFGPSTMSKLEQRGPIGPGESNSNLVKIVQSACFCKGYHAGVLDGLWPEPPLGGTPYYSTSGAIQRLTGDMGVGSINSLPAKVFKALLTMDAYVVVSGGSEDIREIQRWLNERYWTKSFFSIIPCEGIYSRDDQKALMKALQSAFGIPDAQVTGNFGDQTRAGLAANTLKVDDSGLFVQLLSAACVFNGKVPNEKNEFVRTVFKSTFDAPLSEYLTVFQQFSLLDDNGTADYQTWCQLLVSTGDPGRDVSACDTSETITRSMAASLAVEGYKVVGRYLENVPGGTLDKEIKDGELADIFAGGMKVFPIFQYNGRNLANFTWSQGYTQAKQAHNRMIHYGFNPGATIYFAVDYDATDQEITSNIVPYFRGVQAGLANLGRRYRAGVYGSRNVCIRVSDETLTTTSFVSGMSWGFSGNLGFPLPPNWAYNQIQEISYSSGTESIPLDRVVHRASLDPGVGADGVGGIVPSPLAEVFAFVDEVHAAAKSWDSTKADQLTLEYLRSPNYTTVYKGWGVLLGPWDQEWLNHAEDRFFEGREEYLIFSDPTYGEPISMDHLAATANAVLLKGWGAGTGVDATTNRGDFGGWGGDLITFYGDWMSHESSYASGYAFCMERLAKRGIESSFAFNDMVEDADGYLLGRACRNGTAFNVAFREHLGGSGHATRFRDFFRLRFGSSTVTAENAARHMLTGSLDEGLEAIRAKVYTDMLAEGQPTPTSLPAYKFDPYLKGFTDTLKNLADFG